MNISFNIIWKCQFVGSFIQLRRRDSDEYVDVKAAEANAKANLFLKC